MKGRILVVDDDKSIVRLMERILGNEGYHVHSASNGLLALKKAVDVETDIIILDLMLPGMDGFDTCQRLRQGRSTSDIPIVILSAKSQDTDKATAAVYGADAYLTKPVNSAELLEMIEDLLNRDPVEDKRYSIS